MQKLESTMLSASMMNDTDTAHYELLSYQYKLTEFTQWYRLQIITESLTKLLLGLSL